MMKQYVWLCCVWLWSWTSLWAQPLQVVAPQALVCSDAKTECWYYFLSGPSLPYCEGAAIYDRAHKAGQPLCWDDACADGTAMWKVVAAGEGKVWLQNKASHRYLYCPDSCGAMVTTVAERKEATPLKVVDLGAKNAFLLEGVSGKTTVHADAKGKLVGWRTHTLGSASAWQARAVPAADVAYSEGRSDRYVLAWHDEFEQDGPVNPENWTFEEGFVRNKEPQYYQAANAVCKDGNLVITARKERVPNAHYREGSENWREHRRFADYTSSSLITAHHHDLKYGRMEIRAKIPTAAGSWPAIWCKGYPEENGKWPACGEVDILEFYSRSILANLFWSNGKGERQDRVRQLPLQHFTEQDARWADQYHVWRMDWDSTSIRLYVDDELLQVTALRRTHQPVGERCKVENPFHTPMFLLLNLALCPWNDYKNAPYPLRYYIDYVRFYRLRE